MLSVVCKVIWKLVGALVFFKLFNDNRTEIEIMSRAKSIAHASAVKIELSIGRAFVFIILFKTAAHAVLLWSLGPSV